MLKNETTGPTVKDSITISFQVPFISTDIHTELKCDLNTVITIQIDIELSEFWVETLGIGTTRYISTISGILLMSKYVSLITSLIFKRIKLYNCHSHLIYHRD